MHRLRTPPVSLSPRGLRQRRAPLAPSLSERLHRVHLPQLGSQPPPPLHTHVARPFAFEIHQAFLSLANERAKRIPESRVRTLGFRMGEGKKKSFRIGPVRGIDSESPGGVVGAEARAVAQSHAASTLVWRHFSDMNEAITRQLEGIPLKKAEVTSAVRALYISRGDESAAAYHRFRSAVVDFLRARHLIQRRILGRRIFEEFTLRGGGAERRAATAGPVPTAVAASSPPRPASSSRRTAVYASASS